MKPLVHGCRFRIRVWAGAAKQTAVSTVTSWHRKRSCGQSDVAVVVAADTTPPEPAAVDDGPVLAHVVTTCTLAACAVDSPLSTSNIPYRFCAEAGKAATSESFKQAMHTGLPLTLNLQFSHTAQGLHLTHKSSRSKSGFNFSRSHGRYSLF